MSEQQLARSADRYYKSLAPHTRVAVSHLSLALALAAVALAATAWWPGLFDTPGMTAAVVLAGVLTLAASFALSLARTRLRQEQRRTDAKEAELQALLADSRDRERLLNTILDTVDVGIVALDAAGRRLLTNSWQSALETSAAPAGIAQDAEESQLLLTGRD